MHLDTQARSGNLAPKALPCEVVPTPPPTRAGRRKAGAKANSLKLVAALRLIGSLQFFIYRCLGRGLPRVLGFEFWGLAFGRLGLGFGLGFVGLGGWVLGLGWGLGLGLGFGPVLGPS